MAAAICPSCASELPSWELSLLLSGWWSGVSRQATRKEERTTEGLSVPAETIPASPQPIPRASSRGFLVVVTVLSTLLIVGGVVAGVMPSEPWITRFVRHLQRDHHCRRLLPGQRTQ